MIPNECDNKRSEINIAILQSTFFPFIRAFHSCLLNFNYNALYLRFNAFYMVLTSKCLRHDAVCIR